MRDRGTAPSLAVYFESWSEREGKLGRFPKKDEWNRLFEKQSREHQLGVAGTAGE